jgi:hypothetical protein
MNASTETTKSAETSLTRDWIDLGRYHLARYVGWRRGLIILTIAALGTGLAFNWSWLVAIGVAPLLISLAPCAVMCALGLCMSRMGGNSCSAQSPTAREEAETPPSSMAETRPRASGREEHGAALPSSETGNGRS